MTAYYNEIDPIAAEWLRNLISAGHIAPGDVDERSIEDVRPDDLRGYTQCHFFAGIGVWSYALRRAGWDDTRPVWTGSCPCQPFSAAGKGKGFADERHLWPAWFHLIENGKRSDVPVFGEQVASKDGLAWVDLIQTDLEAAHHTLGILDACSAGFGAPHIRQRLFWVAYHSDAGPQGRVSRRESKRREDQHGYAGRGSATCNQLAGGPTNGFWGAADWLYCRDGKWRPVEPGTFPLAHGAPARVGRLRAYGNAINAEQAAEFVKAADQILDVIDLIM